AGQREAAGVLACGRRQEARGDDVALGRRPAACHERRGQPRAGDDREHGHAERRPPVSQQGSHRASPLDACRTRGSIHAVATSARKFPTTTSTTLTTVAPITTG